MGLTDAEKTGDSQEHRKRQTRVSRDLIPKGWKILDGCLKMGRWEDMNKTNNDRVETKDLNAAL